MKIGTDHEKFMRKAIELSRRASIIEKTGGVFGAVIVKDGEIIGTGYNAPPLNDEKNRKCLDEYDFSGKPKYDHTCCMHAEWRAILNAMKENGDILKSGEPFCTVCSRFALDVGIAEFLLWHEAGVCSYDTEEYNNLSYSYKHKF